MKRKRYIFILLSCISILCAELTIAAEAESIKTANRDTLIIHSEVTFSNSKIEEQVEGLLVTTGNLLSEIRNSAQSYRIDYNSLFSAIFGAVISGLAIFLVAKYQERKSREEIKADNELLNKLLNDELASNDRLLSGLKQIILESLFNHFTLTPSKLLNPHFRHTIFSRIQNLYFRPFTADQENKEHTSWKITMLENLYDAFNSFEFEFNKINEGLNKIEVDLCEVYRIQRNSSSLQRNISIHFEANRNQENVLIFFGEYVFQIGNELIGLYRNLALMQLDLNLIMTSNFKANRELEKERQSNIIIQEICKVLPSIENRFEKKYESRTESTFLIYSMLWKVVPAWFERVKETYTGENN